MFKNSWLKYLFFMMILVVADQGIGTAISYYAQKQIRDNRVGLLIDGKINADIYVIGSSRALNNYDPEMIGDSLGSSCYNMGLSGSNILYHEALIDLIISSGNVPRTIIYSVDDHASFFELSNIIFRTDALLPFVYHEHVNEKVCEVLNKNVYATMFSKSYRENVNFINAIKFLIYGQEVADYKTNNLDSLGSNLLVQRNTDPVTVYRNNDWQSHKMKIKLQNWSAFRRIQEKCQAHNIRLIFVLPPIYNNGYPGFRKILDAANLYDSPVLDYTTSFNNASYFFNSDHLNSYGAATFTAQLVNDLKHLK